MKLQQRIRIRGYYTIIEGDTPEELARNVKIAKDRARSDIPMTPEDEIDHRRNRKHFEGYDW